MNLDSRLPRSVGLIPDGNRRWARLNGVPLRAAYIRGSKVAADTVDFLASFGVERIFVYALSGDNCRKRTSLELEIINAVIGEALRRAVEWAESRGFRVVVVGDVDMMDKSLLGVVENLLWDGGKPGDKFVAVAICYYPEWEENVGCGLIRESFGYIDLVFRSGGAKRLSGFFPTLSSRAELYFTDKLWPDVTRKDIMDALKAYMRAERKEGA